MKFSACTAAFGMADLKKIIDTSAKLGYGAYRGPSPAGGIHTGAPKRGFRLDS